MDYTNVCQGWIYCIENKTNNKKYIGQTDNYFRRKREHFCQSERCVILRRAFEKYGINSFEMQPILTVTAINKDVLRAVLNYMEAFYIRKFDTYNNGYNATLGGDGAIGQKITSEETRRKRSEAAKKIVFTDALRKKMRDNAYKREIWKMIERPILQYDLRGNFIREYQNAMEAAKTLAQINGRKNVDSMFHNIHSNLRGEVKKALGYMWKYKTSTYPHKIDAYKHYKEKPVYYFSTEGLLIAKYGSIKEASEATGIKPRTIQSSCHYSALVDFHKVNYWSCNPPT